MIPASFVLDFIVFLELAFFSLFLFIFQQINEQNCFYSILYWDLNSQPLDHVCPRRTTIPGFHCFCLSQGLFTLMQLKVSLLNSCVLFNLERMS